MIPTITINPPAAPILPMIGSLPIGSFCRVFDRDGEKIVCITDQRSPETCAVELETGVLWCFLPSLPATPLTLRSATFDVQ